MKIQQKAFSLIELMIAAALGVILMGMVMYTLSTTSRAMNGTLEQVEMHNRARAILSIITKDFESMEAESTTFNKVDNSGNTTSCVFLTHDRNPESNYPSTTAHDYLWIKYEFDPGTKILKRYAVYTSTSYTAPSFPIPPTLPNRVDVLDIKVKSFFIQAPDVPSYNKIAKANIELESMQGGTTKDIGIAAVIPY